MERKPSILAILVIIVSILVAYILLDYTTTAPQAGTSKTSRNPLGGKMVRLKETVDISLESSSGIVNISSYEIVVVAGEGNITINTVLPNPCYKVEARATPDGVIVFEIVSPARDQVCIQVIKPVAITVPVTVPASGLLRIEIYLDGVLGKSITIRVPS